MTNPPVYPRGYRPRHAADGPDSTPAAARRRADWRPEIQGLRAVAVLLVVVFHQCTHPMVASSTASVDSHTRLAWMSSAL